MSGSRMGRGRAGRFALLSGAIISVVFIVMAYRSTSAEMARLRELHVQCAQQQESLAAQLQVVFDYKEQLEKTLSNEKSANAAAKEELQKKASRERSLRDKDSHEAMQRFNSLQQNYNILKTEHDDLKDDCSKKEKVALANAKELEAKLVELRKKAAEDKKSIDHLKNRLEAIEQERDQIQERHDSLKKTQDDDNGEVEHLQKQVHQLERELEEAKKSAHSSIGRMGNDNSQLLSRLQANDPSSVDNELPVGAAPENNNIGAPVAAEPDPYNNNNNQQMQVIRPSSQQQGVLQGPGDQQSSSSSRQPGKPLTRVKLPVGVPPIPRLIEPKEEEAEKAAAQAPPPVRPAEPVVQPESVKRPVVDEHKPLDRHDSADAWYKLKPGVQEVGDPHHIDKNGFDHGGGNEDVEQYDDYNYKEPQNKNGDLHLEEGEDEREDEDDYVHNNADKHA